jgi:alkylation response protein AidB-like acyl-CoA dehydrogenase
VIFYEEYARAGVADTIGGPEGGWKVAMGTLAFERGASTLGQQLAFENELVTITDAARANGIATDPVVRQRLADAWITLRIMRYHALRSLSVLEAGGVDRASAVHKLFWANFHRDLGSLAVDVLGASGMVAETSGAHANDEYTLSGAQRLFLYSRADTIYGGSNQIQRNVIGERALGLPKEPS